MRASPLLPLSVVPTDAEAWPPLRRVEARVGVVERCWRVRPGLRRARVLLPDTGDYVLVALPAPLPPGARLSIAPLRGPESLEWQVVPVGVPG